MPCHIPKELFHFFRLGSAILPGYDVAVPQFFYNAFHRLHLLLAGHNITEERKSSGILFFYFLRNLLFAFCLVRGKAHVDEFNCENGKECAEQRSGEHVGRIMHVEIES